VGLALAPSFLPHAHYVGNPEGGLKGIALTPPGGVAHSRGVSTCPPFLPPPEGGGGEGGLGQEGTPYIYGVPQTNIGGPCGLRGGHIDLGAVLFLMLVFILLRY
jgi:hypothetical protein